MDRILLIGLDEPEYQALKERVSLPLVFHPTLPLLVVKEGQLIVERHDAGGRFVPVSRVIYHGIFEDDFDVLTALALWGGPCLPGAQGLLDCRLRLPCLARSLQVTRFGAMRRSYADRDQELTFDKETVAKWGNWHCGENKERFKGRRASEVPTV